MNSFWHDRRVSCIFFQVLPLATEVVRWFDMKPLEILWDNYLSRDNTLLCYGSCIALRYSILHAGRLMHFLEQPPPSWKVSFLFCTLTSFVFWSVVIIRAVINTIYVPTVICMLSVHLLCADWVSQKIGNLRCKNNT